MPTTVNHGDMTGLRYQRQLREKGARSVAIKHTQDCLAGDGTPLVILPVRGGAAWSVPEPAAELIRAEAVKTERAENNRLHGEILHLQEQLLAAYDDILSLRSELDAIEAKQDGSDV